MNMRKMQLHNYVGQISLLLLHFKSINCVTNENEAGNYSIEFLNFLDVLGLPPHNLRLKDGSVVIMLRNINQTKLCNGTRLVVSKLMNNVIYAMILKGKFKAPNTSLTTPNGHNRRLYRNSKDFEMAILTEWIIAIKERRAEVQVGMVWYGGLLSAIPRRCVCFACGWLAGGHSIHPSSSKKSSSRLTLTTASRTEPGLPRCFFLYVATSRQCSKNLRRRLVFPHAGSAEGTVSDSYN